MRDNLIMAMVIITFVIGYFIFTSKINKDKFINKNMSYSPGHLIATENDILTGFDDTVLDLKDNFF